MFSKYKNHLVPLFLVLGLLLPQSQLGFYIQATLPFILVLVSGEIIKKPNFILVLIVGVIVISYFTTSTETNIETKSEMRMLYLAIMFLIFPFTNYAKIGNGYLYFTFAIIFMSQLVFVFSIESLKGIIDTLWPVLSTEENRYSVQKITSVDNLETGFGFLRFGGLYRNPNQCARYITVIFALFLIGNKERNSFIKLLFVSFVFISIIISGSRTAMVVFIILFGYSFFFGDITNKKRIINIILGIIMIVTFIYILNKVDTRSVEFESGLDYSFSGRLQTLMGYWEDISISGDIFRLLFGYFAIELTIENDITIMDSEIGNMFFSIGFVGSILLLIFYLKIFRLKYRELNFILILLFWIFSSSILFSYRMSFVFMLILSNYYSKYLSEKAGNAT